MNATRFTFAFIVTAWPVAAMTDLEAYQLSSDLGTLLAAEELCELTFDEQAVAAYISETVPAERIDFAAKLQGMTAMSRLSLDNLSPSGKAAHCAAVTKSAKHLGFVK